MVLLESLGDHNFTLFFNVKIVFREQACLSGSIAHCDPALLGGLDIALEVASDSIPNSDKAEFNFIKGVSMVGGKLKELLSQPVVVLLLLNSIVEG